MIVYIAGSISKRINTYQYDFSDAEMVLREAGHVVLSPAWLPIGLHSWDDYMKISDAMLEASDGVAFLEGWEESKGAQIEHEKAVALGKKIMYYDKEKGVTDDADFSY